MTDKECIGIDCAWCCNPKCPNEKKELDRQKIVDAFTNAYNKHFKENAENPWRK